MLHIFDQQKDRILSLPEANSANAGDFFIEEDKVITLTVELPFGAESVSLQIGDHELPMRLSERINDMLAVFVWAPHLSNHNGALFYNLCGIIEPSVSFTVQGQTKVLNYAQLEVLSRLAEKDNVESMIQYLCKLGETKLHALLDTSLHNAGFDKSESAPLSQLQRIEDAVKQLAEVVSGILTNPMHRLEVAKHRRPYSADSLIDDESLIDLLGQPADLRLAECGEPVVFSHDESNYVANVVLEKQVQRNYNVEENRVIVSALCYLQQMAKNQLAAYDVLHKRRHRRPSQKANYVSLVNQLSKLEYELTSSQRRRCDAVIRELDKVIHVFCDALSLTVLTPAYPRLTSKAAADRFYRRGFEIYHQLLQQRGVNWTLYEMLLSINTLPKLFELYALFRLDESLLSHCVSTKAMVYSKAGKKIILRYEPEFFGHGHKRQNENDFVNIEHRKNARHRYNKRQPDFVIECLDSGKIAVLDAKYSTYETVRERRLSECVMKYVHGIGRADDNAAVVSSLTLLYPSRSIDFNSFHDSRHCIWGECAVEPSLQLISLQLLDSPLTSDMFDRLVGKLISTL